MAVSIKFIGAAHTVTGSCYVVTTSTSKFIVDCGMYQGPDVEIRNLEDFTFDPAEIDFLFLTHTHLDHVGLLPKLIAGGFRGPIYSTLHTAQVAEVILFDSAKIQEKNFTEGIAWKHAKKVALIYDTGDVEQTLSQFQIVDFHERFSPVPEMEVEFVHAGHVLGAASIHIVVDGHKIVFSGDIGRTKQELIHGYDETTDFKPDTVIMESLYGGQTHPSRPESVKQLIDIIRETTNNGGSVFIPSFAVQRTQEILHDIKLAKKSGALSENLPVLLDSPMAQRVTNIYESALDTTEDSLMQFPGLRYVRNSRKSFKLSKKSGQVVIAGSGMADGGRIMMHIAQNIGNHKNAIVFVGFQAEATLGRELTQGAKRVIIDQRGFDVKAQVYHLTGFSAHGDTNDYSHWLSRFDRASLKNIFLVHAEPERSQLLREQLKDEGYTARIEIPDREENINL